MSDWQVGDLALCISTRHRKFSNAATRVRRGAIYTVERVGTKVHFGTDVALQIAGAPTRVSGYGWPSTMFRKIHPHAPDVEDRETISLLNGKPALAPAHD